MPINEVLVSRIRQCPTLPSLPAVAIQILELVQKPDVDAGQIARTIAKDPALTSKILRTVNSSFYARSHAVSTVNHALVVLGLQSVKTLVLGFSLVSDLRQRGFKHPDYWRRSIYAATAARVIAAKIGVLQQEEAFLAGLMADVGTLVLHHVLGDAYDRICASVTSHEALPAAENAALGLDHAYVAGILAEQWKLPPILAVPMAHHHSAQAAADPALCKIAQAVFAGGRCAEVFLQPKPAAAIAAVRSFCREFFEMSEADCDALMNDIGLRAREAAPLFEISLPATSSYQKILERAGEALVELTLAPPKEAGQQIEEGSISHPPARALEMPRADAGELPDRSRFDSALAEQFAAAVSQGMPLSVVLMEVDHFDASPGEMIRGEHLLKWIGSEAASIAARPRDLTARFGSEQIAILLPATEKKFAAAVAEAVRRRLAAKSPPLATGLVSPATVSMGVATYEAGGPLKEPGHLVKAVDLALYAARQSGRNCVRVFTLPKTPAAQFAAA